MGQSLIERCKARLKYGIISGCGQEHADAPHAFAWLRTRRERPRCRAAEKRYELAPM
jgi:hypothetical protein